MGEETMSESCKNKCKRGCNSGGEHKEIFEKIIDVLENAVIVEAWGDNIHGGVALTKEETGEKKDIIILDIYSHLLRIILHEVIHLISPLEGKKEEEKRAEALTDKVINSMTLAEARQFYQAFLKAERRDPDIEKEFSPNKDTGEMEIRDLGKWYKE